LTEKEDHRFDLL